MKIKQISYPPVRRHNLLYAVYIETAAGGHDKGIDIGWRSIPVLVAIYTSLYCFLSSGLYNIMYLIYIYNVYIYTRIYVLLWSDIQVLRPDPLTRYNYTQYTAINYIIFVSSVLLYSWVLKNTKTNCHEEYKCTF